MNVEPLAEQNLLGFEHLCRLLPAVHPRRGAEQLASIFAGIADGAPEAVGAILGITPEQAIVAAEDKAGTQPSGLTSKLVLKVYEAGLLQPCSWLGRPVRASQLEAYIGQQDH